MQDFPSYLADSGMKPNTIKGYRNRVNAFLASGLLPEEFVRCGKTPEARLRFAAIQKYREYQAYLQRAGHTVQQVPDLEHARIKRAKPDPVPHMSQKQARALLDKANSIGPRTGLLFALLYGQGLRVSEALDVRLDQIDLEAEVLWVDGKSGPREMPLMPFVARAINRWLLAREKLAGLNEPRLIVGPLGGRMCVRLVERTARKMLRFIGLPEDVKRPCHVLRHAFARHCWEQGMDIRLIQTWLGHAELKTTERYIGVSQLRMQEARRFHPLADDVQAGLSVVQPVLPVRTDLQSTLARLDTA